MLPFGRCVAADQGERMTSSDHTNELQKTWDLTETQRSRARSRAVAGASCISLVVFHHGGVRVVPGVSREPSGPRDEWMKAIARCGNPALAHLICGYLDAHGCPARVVGGPQGLWGSSGAPGEMQASVYVATAFERRARELLTEFEESRMRGEPWFCPKCGDVLSTEFGECPVCRVVRPPKKSQMPGCD